MWRWFGEYLGTIHFLHPGWLWGWPFALIVIGFLVWTRRLRSLARAPLPAGEAVYRHPRSGLLRALQGAEVAPAAGGPLRRWLHYAAFSLCVCAALAQPYRNGAPLPVPTGHRDTLFLVDTSLNMSLRDYLSEGRRVSRMSIVKSMLAHFIGSGRERPGNRIGLIVFSERAYTLVPLTADRALLKSMLRFLEPAVLTGRTTNLGEALLYTLRQLQRGAAPADAPKPALVLISGVNWTYRDVDPRAVAGYLHARGYRLYAVAIGAPSAAAGQSKAAGLIYEPANFTLMKSLAARGGGRFYEVDSARSLAAAVRSIQAAERHRQREVRAEPRYARVPLYQWPLSAGLLWLALPQLFAGLFRRS